jgi:hypothetical protein
MKTTLAFAFAIAVLHCGVVFIRTPYFSDPRLRA